MNEELSSKCAECERVDKEQRAVQNLCRKFNERENALRWEIEVVKQQLSTANETILRMAKEMSQLQQENSKLKGQL